MRGSIIIDHMIVSKSMVLGVVIGAIAAVVFVFAQQTVEKFINPVSKEESRTLEKYSFPSLKKTTFQPSAIDIGEKLSKDIAVNTYVFTFYDNGKKVSGLLNAPKLAGTYPVLIMFRGYVDKEIYSPGIGTQHAAEYFARHGFITLAPDFLGYGSSDPMSNDSLESRFQTYTSGLILLNSFGNLNDALATISDGINADPDKTAIWAHSNGGQVALSVLEISGKKIPTSLWAPVTHPFPESILFFADEMDDGGKYIRGIVADFVQKYNPRLYSPPQYVSWLKAPIQLHQGTADDAVPKEWSDTFANTIKNLHKPITYYIYNNEDHNFAQGSWSTVVARDLQFYRKNLDL